MNVLRGLQTCLAGLALVAGLIGPAAATPGSPETFRVFLERH